MLNCIVMGATLAAAVLMPFSVSWLLTAALVRWAPRLGLVDFPDDRKVHSRPTPKGGGLAIFVALATAALALNPSPSVPDPPLVLMLLGLGGLIVAIGLLDDRRPLPWQWRLAAQFAVAGAAVLWSGLGTDWPLRLLEIVWVVGLVNAFNMIDNMDGLAGGVAMVAAACFAIAWALGGDLGRAALYLMMMGAVCGFLCFNSAPARIFMGDAGSTFLGYFLGLGGLDLARRGPALAWAWAVPLAVLAVPWYDLISVVTIRLSQGRSPFHADRQHLSHRLVDGGWRPATVVRLTHLLALVSGAAGLLLYRVGPAGAVAVSSALALGWVAMAVAEIRARRTKKETSHV